MKAPGLRLNPSDTAAVARNLVMVLAVTILALYWGPAGAATAAAAAGAITGAVALHDSPVGRVPLVIVVSVQVGVAVLLGALSAAHSVAFVGVVAAWSFFAGMQWAISGPVGLIAAISGVLLVVQHPQSVGTALASSAFAVAAGLAQAAMIAIRPPRRWRAEGDALTTVYQSLGADARALATEPAAEVDAAPLLELKETFSSGETQQSRRTPEYRDWHTLPEQIAETLMHVHGKAASQDTLAGTLIAAADALSAIGTHGHGARRDADYAIKRLDVAVAGVAGPEAVGAQHLSEQLHRAQALRFGHRRISDWTEAFTAAVDVVKSHLTPMSPILRHAVRLSFAAAAGAAVAVYSDVPQGHWIPLTVLLVMRPETAHTYTRCVGRIAAIGAGVVVATCVTLIWHPAGLIAALLAVVFMGLTYAVAPYGYLAVTAASGASVVFLLDIQGAASSISDLLLATVIGGSLAVIAHVVVPDDAMVRLRQRSGELLKTEIDYASTVIKAFVHDLDHPADALSAAWQRAFRARAAFEAAAGATRVESGDLRRWLRSFRTALNNVTSACTTLEASLPAHPSDALSREFILAIDDYVEVLRGDPPTPAEPWSIDTVRLASAETQLRDAATHFAAEDGAVRVLVAEIGTITRSLAGIPEVSPRAPTEV